MIMIMIMSFQSNSILKIYIVRWNFYYELILYLINISLGTKLNIK